MTTVEDESVVPEFAHAVRGYDRFQVDDYIERLNEWAAGTHSRAVEAEKTIEQQARHIEALRDRVAELEEHRLPSADEALREAAERTAEMVSAAVAQADEIRRRASADADRRLDEASRQAVDIVEAARRSVAGLSDEAARERRESRGRAQIVLDEVRHQTDGIRLEAEETARTTVAEAGAEATRIVEEAERLAADTRQRSEAERASHEAAVAKLLAERRDIMEELGRLRGAIQSLLSGVTGAEVAPVAPEQLGEEADEDVEPPAGATPGD